MPFTRCGRKSRSKGFLLIKEFPRWVTEGKKSPTGRHAFTTCKFWTADEPLLVSGLLGPVRLEVVQKTPVAAVR